FDTVGSGSRDLSAADLERQIRRDDEQAFQYVGGALRAYDQHRLSAARVGQRQQEPGDAEDVVAVDVANQDQIDVLDAPAEGAQTDLGALAAVEHDEVAAVAHEHAGERPI